MNLLQHIHSPQDLKQLSYEQLETLCAEIRSLLIDVTSRNGGHLAPNLGVVELTVALHKVFSCPRDKIVWDVGHQAYVHKILTGRQEAFRTLRQFGGLCGFPRRDESPCDCFGTGHSSTSISAALGIACARDLVPEDDFSDGAEECPELIPAAGEAAGPVPVAPAVPEDYPQLVLQDGVPSGKRVQLFPDGVPDPGAHCSEPSM